MRIFNILLLCCLTLSGFSQTFNEVIKATAFDRSEEDRMGYAVDISGDYAIVGAYGDDFGPFDPNMGSAYIFEKTGIEDWHFVQKITNSDQDDYDRFGWSVAIDGGYAVVGAYGEDHDVEDAAPLSKAGSAYVYERDETGVWHEVQKLVASDRDTSDEFGWTVDVSDNTVIVGAHHEGHNAIGEDFIFKSGSVYVFDRSDAGVWEETQKVVAWDRQADSGGGDETINIWHYQDIDYGDLFGCSIAISGDYMIVGAHNGDYNEIGESGVTQSGAAYIFKKDAGIWGADQKVIATVRSGWDRYGYSVAIDSNVAVVGAKAEDHNEFDEAFLQNAGSAYVYTRDLTGEWGVQKIDGSDRDVGDHFGIEVAVDGDYMVIGAEAHNYDAFGGDELANAGTAYVFEKEDDGTWAEIEKIAASDRDSLDLFGDAVALSEHTIIVGAWQQDLDSASTSYLEDAGGAYFFSSLLCSADSTEQAIALCDGESLSVGSSVYTVSGTYIDTLANADACDSIVITHLIVAPLIEADTSINLCFGESYEIGASIYTETGTYNDTLTAISGCDSIVTTALVINAENMVAQTLSFCSGESVTVGESVYFSEGVYTDVLTASDLCDSTVITTVTIITEINITIDESAYPTLSSNEPAVGSVGYQWINCETMEGVDGATEINFTPAENGTYAVVISKDFCSDTSECFTVLDLSLNSAPEAQFTLYPNPTNGVFTINFADMMQGGELTIYDYTGAVVYTTLLSNQTTILALSNLAGGTYMVQVTTDQGVLREQVQIVK